MTVDDMILNYTNGDNVIMNESESSDQFYPFKIFGWTTYMID